MKKSFILAGFLAVISILTGCGNVLSDQDSEFGSLTIKSGTVKRSVDVSSITSSKVVVTGTGIDDGSLSTIVAVKNGQNAGDIFINDIPVGKNRIVTVYAYDSDGQLDENEAVLRAVTDIKSGSNSVSVDKSTTALGNVFEYLHELGYNVKEIDSAQKEKIQAAIDSDKSYSEINSAQIANDIKNSGFESLKDKAEYVNGYGGAGGTDTNIVIHVNGYQYVWYWNDGEDGALAEMSDDSEKGDGWYTYTFENKSKINLILRPKGGSDWSGQTANLSRTPGNWYYEGGVWSGSSSSDTTAPSVEWKYPENGAAVSECVHFIVDASDADTGIASVEYFVDDASVFTTSGSFSCTFDTSDLTNGTHTVYAVVKDGAGNSAESEKITITTKNAEKAPKAVVSSTKICTESISTTFDGSKSTGSISAYTWDFGDGSTGTGVTAEHTYSTKGSYTAKLTVTSAGGLTDSAEIAVTVQEKGSFMHRDFREETVYFMMTDRFCDGDSSNNNIWGDEYMPNGSSQMYEYSEDPTGVLSYYHGGDFKGIIKNLDYLKDMGFTAIWITPSVKQAEGRYFSDSADGYNASAFHGYWGYDFDQIDPHLHSSGKNSDGWADYKAFIDACHAKGIRVMQDIVINHGNQGNPTKSTKWYSTIGKVKVDGTIWDYNDDAYNDGYKVTDDDGNVTFNAFFNYVGGYKMDGTALLDFNERGQSGKDARQHLINVYKKYIDAGVDAFRVDTIAYVTNEFAGEFADAMYNYAKEKGNDYFYLVTEGWCKRSDAIERASKDTTDSMHMLDMQLSCLDYPGEMYKVFGGQDSIGATYNNVMGTDKNYSYMTADEYTKTGMFVDNHDSYRCNGRFSEAQYKNALNFIYLFRGVPIVYYGTEACYAWDGAHSSTNKEDVVARWMLGDNGISYVKNNQPAMYKHLKVLNELYHSSECIQKGAQTDLSLNSIPAAFTRTWNGKTAAVILNHQDSAGSYSFSNLPSGTYTLYTSDGSGTLNKSTVSVSGSYKLDAPANGFAVLDPQ